MIGPTPGGPLVPAQRAVVEAGHGIQGDRTYRRYPDPYEEPGRDLTLIEAEALEALEQETGIALAPGEARRNVVTRGIVLAALVGRRFRIGELECLGVEPCEPCHHLARLTQPGVLRGLVHRGGIRADVLRDGSIALGDPVEAL
jgi:MOSC domain-containing protein YiiM